MIYIKNEELFLESLKAVNKVISDEYPVLSVYNSYIHFVGTSRDSKIGNIKEDAFEKTIKEKCSNLTIKHHYPIVIPVNNEKCDKEIDHLIIIEDKKKIVSIEQKAKDNHDRGTNQRIGGEVLSYCSALNNEYPGYDVYSCSWYSDEIKKGKCRIKNGVDYIYGKYIFSKIDYDDNKDELYQYYSDKVYSILNEYNNDIDLKFIHENITELLNYINNDKDIRKEAKELIKNIDINDAFLTGRRKQLFELMQLTDEDISEIKRTLNICKNYKKMKNYKNTDITIKENLF